MKASFPRLLALLAIFANLAAPLSSLRAQGLSGSSLRNTVNDIDRDAGRVQSIIDRSEQSYRLGEKYLQDRNPDAARVEFDKAVDVVLESGMDVRANPKLQTFYLQLVERVYRLEVPAQGAQGQAVVAANTPAQPLAGGAQVIAANAVNDQVAQQPSGFLRDQKFEPSPLDELSKLVLTEQEQQVSTEEIVALEEAKTDINFKFSVHPLVQQFINYYQGRGRGTMESGLRRSGRYMAMARKIFREEGVPEDIAWLAQVESAWRPNAYSWAAASGLWQFIPSTGMEYGLRQTAWIDERNSFEKATRASARYLKHLNRYFNGNWELALGAYNTGPGNIDRGVRRAGAADFWRIYPYIAQETRNYVPNILATILIAKNPEKYGFRNVRPEAPLAYDVVNVPSATSLQLVASSTDTSVDYVRSLNPELRRDTTPRGESYNLRVPAGRGKSFVALLKRVPADRRESARVVSIAPGEDLASVANRTGMSQAQLQLWNAGADLSKGGKLVVPSGGLQKVIYPVRRANVQSTASALTTYRAKAGETIAQIAARYSVSADEVARLNAYAADAPLVANQVIRVPAKTPAAATTGAAPVRRRR
jgi:membrane-bound lytic murein transglycosylase D